MEQIRQHRGGQQADPGPTKRFFRELLGYRLPPMDLPFLVLVLTLVAFGLVMLYSASYAVALYRRNDAFAYIRPQLLFAAVGLIALYLASRVDYHIYHKLAWPMLGLSLVLLVVVLFMPEYNGCKRWIVLPGLGTLQPRSGFRWECCPSRLFWGCWRCLCCWNPTFPARCCCSASGRCSCSWAAPVCAGLPWRAAWGRRPSPVR